MQSVDLHLFRRGKRGTFYLRRRIPADVLDSYPRGKREVVVSLGTSDRARAVQVLRRRLVALDDDFESKRVALRARSLGAPRRRVRSLNAAQLDDLARLWVHAVLDTDESQRRDGLDEHAFAALGHRIDGQRAELGRMLARGNTQPVVPAFRAFLHLAGLDATLAPHDEQQAAYRFLQAAVAAVEAQARRQAGDVVPTPAAPATARTSPTWDAVFAAWRDYVVDRPKPTTIACRTAWRQLEEFARARDMLCPAHVAPPLVSSLVNQMQADGLCASTVNERLRKIRAVYRIAVGRGVLQDNPAAATLGLKQPKHMQGRDRRLPFSADDLQAIFGSPIFTRHRRSPGQSGEASYWIPLLMFYSGARPEEVAGLRVDDLRHAKGLGWYLHLTDLPDGDEPCKQAVGDDADSTTGGVERRLLKNPASRRNVPVAKELVDLGLLRYVEQMKRQGHVMLFPTLRPDAHGKLSGAHGKFFGRYKKALGIEDPRKVLYSFRHNMKDFLEAANVPSKYLQRILGHTTGDGAVTDGYGSDLPLERLVRYFRRVKFPVIPALPWRPGTGVVRLDEVASHASAQRKAPRLRGAPKSLK
jgi:integrase